MRKRRPTRAEISLSKIGKTQDDLDKMIETSYKSSGVLPMFIAAGGPNKGYWLMQACRHSSKGVARFVTFSFHPENLETLKSIFGNPSHWIVEFDKRFAEA